MLLCLNMTPGEETERTGQDRTVLGDKSRVGSVTGKKKAKGVAALVFCCPKNMETRGRQLYVWSFTQFTGKAL